LENLMKTDGTLELIARALATPEERGDSPDRPEGIGGLGP
jgi:hypothetical protein